MKYVVTILFTFVFGNSFAQMPPPQSDSFAYETYSDLKHIDSSVLSQEQKNELTFEKLRNFISKRPGDGFWGDQLLLSNRNYDTTRLDILFKIFDTSIQKQYAEHFTALRIQSSLMRGKRFPEMILMDSLKRPLNIADLKGKVVLIDFWASWCGPCRAEMPKLISLYKKFKDKGFVVIAVSLDENKEDWLKAIHDDSLPWIHFCDLVSVDNNSLSKKWGIFSIPYYFLINKDGILLDKGESMEISEKELSKLL